MLSMRREQRFNVVEIGCSGAWVLVNMLSPLDDVGASEGMARSTSRKACDTAGCRPSSAGWR